MLAVPAWLGRFGCRVTELAVDPARLRLSTPDADSAEAEVDEAVRRRIRSNGPQQAVVPLTPAGGAPAGGGFSSGEQIRPAGVAKEAPPGLLVRRVRLEDSTVGIYKCNGYLKISCNGGLNQIRSEICDMVAIARQELDKRSFWADQRFMKPEPLDWFELQKSIMSAELKLSSDLYYLEPSKNAPDGLVRMYGEGDMDGLLRAHSGTKLCHLYIVDQYFQRYYESDGMDDIVDDQYCTYSDGGMDDSD